MRMGEDGGGGVVKEEGERKGKQEWGEGVGLTTAIRGF